MNFKEIKMFGFKSFVDETEIQFNNGVTAIVGPNGCGKSNFSDAIRWVLGENRPTILRTDSTRGLIFGGTDLRKPLSYCEVTLVLDNSDRILPVEYSEIEIKRKGYKSGTSEFFINGNRCRLQDVQDILRDTGMGREGYSIIAQGKIAEIIQNPPKKRRAIFEEAAGIATFKKRKDDAENKLKRTQENIEKIQLVINEIESLLEPLKKQAENARKAKELQEQQKILEVNQYLYQTENAHEIKGAIEIEIAGLRDELTKAEANRILDENKLNGYKIRVAQLEAEIENLQKYQTEYLVNKEALKGDQKENTAKISGAQKEKDRLEKTLSDDDALIIDLESKLEVLNSDKQKLEADKDILLNKIEIAQKALDDVNKELGISSDALETQRDTALQALALMGDIQANKSKYETEKNLLNEDIKDLQNKLGTNNNELNKIKSDYDALQKSYQDSVRTRENANKIKEQTYAELKGKSNECEIIINDFNRVESELKLANQTLIFMQGVKDNYEGFTKSVQTLMKDSKNDALLKDKIEGLVVELMTMPAKFDAAISAVLGNQLQSIVVRNEEDGKFIIRYLKENRIGIATCLPISTYKAKYLENEYKSAVNETGALGVASDLIKYDPRYESIYVGLLGRTLVCDNLDNAVKVARKYCYGFRIVTLDGDILATTGAMTGGARNVQKSNIIETDRKIEELKKQIIYLKEDCERLKKQKEKALEEYKAMQEDFQQAQSLMTDKEVKIAKEEEKLRALAEELSRANLIVEETADLIQKKTDRLNVITQGLKDVEEKANQATGSKSEKDKAIEHAKLEQGRLQNKKEELTLELQGFKVEEQTLNNKLLNVESNKENAENEIVKAKVRMSENRDLLTSQQTEIDRIQESMKNNVLTEEEQAKYNEIVEELMFKKDEKEELNQSIEKLQEEKETALTLIGEKKERKAKAEGKLEKINADMDRLAGRILEEYSLTYEGAKKYRQEEFDYKESIQKVVNIKREMTKLGAINYTAIDQYEFQKARYDRFTRQVDDLKTAENNLLEVINDLATSMLQKFNDEFDKINKNFGEVFKELFGGGSASLIIQEPQEDEDELSAGIEINANPPGKNIGTIASLSGGEQAMTAIAILFAILKVKAVPFCVLDEIDAALDDSNVYLFANYLKKYSESTQFIVITHRQPTMQAADILNGVTMEERGVSRVYNVSIQEAINVLAEAEAKQK